LNQPIATRINKSLEGRTWATDLRVRKVTGFGRPYYRPVILAERQCPMAYRRPVA